MKKLIAIAIVSLAAVGLDVGRASAWYHCPKSCCTTCKFCCVQPNAFSPYCCYPAPRGCGSCGCLGAPVYLPVLAQPCPSSGPMGCGPMGCGAMGSGPMGGMDGYYPQGGYGPPMGMPGTPMMTPPTGGAPYTPPMPMPSANGQTMAPMYGAPMQYPTVQSAGYGAPAPYGMPSGQMYFGNMTMGRN